MTDKDIKETPLMKQYNLIKKKYPGALLLFRVGDFYETFGEDAIKTSKILGIVLTKRANGSASSIELAGFPYHALDNYLSKLIKAGQRVAICDQLEDPKMVKGIVKRGVTELVTPGVSLNDHVLDIKKNNYLCSIHLGKGEIGIAFLDISTGEFLASQGNLEYIDKLLQSFTPAEILFSKPRKNEFPALFGDKHNTYFLEDWVFQFDFAYEKLTKHFKTNSLKGFGIEILKEGITASGAILHYLAETEHHEINHITHISRLEEDKYVWLDKFTIRNLELVFPQQEGGVPLIEILDKTQTPMGARLLRKWILLPLKDIQKIEERLSIVDNLVKQPEVLEKLLEPLRCIGDLERLISKVAAKRINPREMLQLKRALSQMQPLKDLLGNLSEAFNNTIFTKIIDQIAPCEELLNKIEKELKDEVPIVVNQGKMIKGNVCAELDDLHEIANSSKDYLDKLIKKEIERTGINSLKVSYNKVFGYYLEVTHTHKNKVPADWERKQTLVNAERYVTHDLKIYEEKILTAEEKIATLEQQLFFDLIIKACEFIQPIQQNAKIVSLLDCLASFATTAIKNDYYRPKVNLSHSITIKDGRHPVIEQQLPLGEQYIPNDIFLDNDSQQIIIITGPNMAGKSALLRQVALITLMAQIGSFVPATQAEIGLVDKIFTRVGASDNLSRGESTFMVEMTETASIMNNLSERSLILMDEIGRGTSTYDGISIAWSIVEYLHNHPIAKPKTLFATHYHELNELTNDLPRVKNYNVSIKELENKIIFMRKLKPGGSEHSFGIHVAQMAGMPLTIVERANEILHQLEKDKVHSTSTQNLQEIAKPGYQLKIFEASNPSFDKLKNLLDKVDINTTSPVEALLKLNELKIILNKS